MLGAGDRRIVHRRGWQTKRPGQDVTAQPGRKLSGSVSVKGKEVPGTKENRCRPNCASLVSLRRYYLARPRFFRITYILYVPLTDFGYQPPPPPPPPPPPEEPPPPLPELEPGATDEEEMALESALPKEEAK